MDALEDIRADEVKAISAELRRSVTRHNQIVPEIAKLVAQKRANANRTGRAKSPWAEEFGINEEEQKMRAQAKCQADIEYAWQWERDARIAAGLHVEPLPKPLTAAEIAGMSPAMVKMGLKCGALTYRGGQITDTAA